jgi:hypothetical protein
MSDNQNWWKSIPGILTAVAGIITAFTGLIVALHQIGVFTKDVSPETPPPVVANSNDTVATASIHCDKPTIPILKSPGANQVQPNHYYGKGKPLEFTWLASSCKGGTVKGYRLYVKAVGATVPAIDKVVTETKYVGDTTGTISANKWTWKVQAIDNLNQLSEWSEERPYFVGNWK